VVTVTTCAKNRSLHSVVDMIEVKPLAPRPWNKYTEPDRLGDSMEQHVRPNAIKTPASRESEPNVDASSIRSDDARDRLSTTANIYENERSWLAESPQVGGEYKHSSPFDMLHSRVSVEGGMKLIDC
jgi:hypothetical protein